MIEAIQSWMDLNPTLAPWAVSGGGLVLSLLVFLIARYIIARGLVYLAKRTESKYDDIVVQELRPFRFAWIAPVLVIYAFAGLLPQVSNIIQKIALFLILWLVVTTFNSILNALNTIYESSDFFHGLSIQGYLDLVKILLIVTSLILTVSLFTGESPVALLSGLGALTAILLLIFRDTLLSFVASLQILSNELIKEGDWIEVPSYGADGEVLNIALHTVRVQNWDKTITVIPTYKLTDTPYKNWRGMEESGGRRIKRSLHIDLNSLRFCDQEMIERFSQIDLIKQYMETKRAQIEQWNRAHPTESPDTLGGRDITNMSVFRAYVFHYLKSRTDLHQEGMTMLVRQLTPGTTGLPLEIYTFAKTVVWAEYEAIQGEIFDHLVAAVPKFGLRVFQQPTGLDFQAFVRA